MMKILIASATLAVLAAPALAQQPTVPAAPPAATEDKFTKHDANKDGALTIAEVKAADAKVTQADFDMYDSDKSKSLSKVEFAKWAEAKTTPPASAPGQ
jgi:hypothetical protein